MSDMVLVNVLSTAVISKSLWSEQNNLLQTGQLHKNTLLRGVNVSRLLIYLTVFDFKLT